MGDITRAIGLMDEYNKRDPRRIRVGGEDLPTEYFLALSLGDWVRKLDPAAGEPLLLAARCQHIGRWEIARDEYPEGRNGYFRWRKALARHHAEVAGTLLARAGYGPELIAEVQGMVRKEQLGSDPRVQVLEDGLCLVFLQHQFEEFSGGVTEEKMTDILRKTWKKMSPAAREAASSLSYSPRCARLIDRALEAA